MRKRQLHEKKIAYLASCFISWFEVVYSSLGRALVPALNLPTVKDYA